MYENDDNDGAVSDAKPSTEEENDVDKKSKQASDHRIAAILTGAVAESSVNNPPSHKAELSFASPTAVPENEVVTRTSSLPAPSSPGSVALVSGTCESKKSKDEGTLSLLRPSGVSMASTMSESTPATMTSTNDDAKDRPHNIFGTSTNSPSPNDDQESPPLVTNHDKTNAIPITETAEPHPLVAEPALDDDDVAARVAQQLEEQIDSQWKERFEQEVQAQLDAQRQKETSVHVNQPKESFSSPKGSSNNNNNNNNNFGTNCDDVLKPKTLLVIAFLALLLIGGVVGAVVAATSSSSADGGKSDDSTMVPSDTVSVVDADIDPTGAPTSSPTVTVTLSRRDFWVDRIATGMDLGNSSAYMALLDDSLSPQAQALQWLSQEDEYTMYPNKLDPQELLERYAFLVFYYSTTSGLDWLIDPSTSICQWNVKIDNYYHGIYCVDSNHFGLVSHIFLSGWQIAGTIPWEITWLSHMTHWFMDTNALTGSIPSGLDRLTALQYIMLYWNFLTGAIPSRLPDSLTYLVLYNNTLEGTLPTDWPDEIPNVAAILLDQNQLEGSIPSAWGEKSSSFPALEALTLSNNMLTGSIPTALGQFSKLMFLSLGSNQLTGKVPTELGDLSMMAQLSFHDNLLTGTMPQAFGQQFQYLNTFWFHWNYLTGSVDSIFCNDGDVALDALESLQADCWGDNPVMECSCCTVCCSLELDICHDM